MQRIVELVLHDRAMLRWLAKVASISSILSKKLLGYAYTVKRVRTHHAYILCYGKRWILRVRRFTRCCCRCSCENPVWGTTDRLSRYKFQTIGRNFYSDKKKKNERVNKIVYLRFWIYNLWIYETNCAIKIVFIEYRIERRIIKNRIEKFCLMPVLYFYIKSTKYLAKIMKLCSSVGTEYLPDVSSMLQSTFSGQFWNS